MQQTRLDHIIFVSFHSSPGSLVFVWFSFSHSPFFACVYEIRGFFSLAKRIKCCLPLSICICAGCLIYRTFVWCWVKLKFCDWLKLIGSAHVYLLSLVLEHMCTLVSISCEFFNACAVARCTRFSTRNVCVFAHAFDLQFIRFVSCVLFVIFWAFAHSFIFNLKKRYFKHAMKDRQGESGIETDCDCIDSQSIYEVTNFPSNSISHTKWMCSKSLCRRHCLCVKHTCDYAWIKCSLFPFWLLSLYHRI